MYAIVSIEKTIACIRPRNIPKNPHSATGSTRYLTIQLSIRTSIPPPYILPKSLSECAHVRRVHGYNTTLSMCMPCMGQCLTCTDSISCTSCNNENGLVMSAYNQGQCICLSLSYYDQNEAVCYDCPSYCLKCSAMNQCDQCQSPSYSWNPQSKQCEKICPQNQYLNTSSAQCVPCTDKNCVECYEANHCKQCAPQYILYSNFCVRICELEQYYDYGASACAPCNNYCSFCDNASTCQICLPGYQLNSESKCVVE
eukprot:TRINITY_DN1723_c0_g1_i2.p2 TRINITY_DN1723_c0_g1~~TRINITY_DN1723_c0_g1_i2.p2  ORF type:complete len:255 (-),score=23.06 TRINITY_DN1723_c0_g1_i2:75-839(-)